jgi:hypothetical protein
MNTESSETVLAPAPSGTPVTLQGVICHETMGGKYCPTDIPVI